MKSAREAVTADYWRKSLAVLNHGDPFARESLILLAQSRQETLELLANAATRTLLAYSMRQTYSMRQK